MRKDLNFGYIETGQNAGFFNFAYNAPGFGGSVTSPAETILSMAGRLATSARTNIEYLQRYVDFIDHGKVVAQCKNSWLGIVGDTPQMAMDGCVRWQGGFVKFWTRDELTAEQEPYSRMLKDADWMVEFVEANKAVPKPPKRMSVGQAIREMFRRARR